MLLLWAVPGIVVWIYLRRRVRQLFGIGPKDRVLGAPMGGLWEEVAGFAFTCGLLVLWPLALVSRTRVAELLCRHPWLVLRTE